VNHAQDAHATIKLHHYRGRTTETSYAGHDVTITLLVRVPDSGG
jgi:hypothetical protein